MCFFIHVRRVCIELLDVEPVTSHIVNMHMHRAHNDRWQSYIAGNSVEKSSTTIK